MEENRENREDNFRGVEEEIRCSAKQIPVPDALQPVQIGKRLRSRKRKRYYGYGIAAACCCLIVGTAAYALKEDPGNLSSQKTAAVSENVEKSDMETKSSQRDDGLTYAKSYEEIFGYLNAEENTGVVYETAEAKTMSDTAEASGHSALNVRTEGVGEADVVSTDGSYLYTVSQNTVRILDIREDAMKETAVIRMKETDHISQIYLEEDMLLCIYNRYSEDGQNTGENRNYTVAEVYDVSTPDKPKSMGEVSQSGSFSSVRITDGYVYLLSDFYVQSATAKEDPAAYIPEIQGKLMDSGFIILPSGNAGRNYTVVTSFKLEDPKGEVDNLAFFGSGGSYYVSSSSIYMYNTVYDPDSSGNQTDIRKVSYQKGMLDGAGHAKVQGTIKDSFCIDEYEGYLRIVATVWNSGDSTGGIMPLPASGEADTGTDSTNALYILNEEMEIVGSLEGLAPGENIYAARLMGDTGYFVTYRQTDPVFAADLSNPEKPQIIGELKLPGFSDYLHPYGDGQLLGIGMETDEEGVTTEGVKLSMFDISDPEKIKEVSKEVMKGCYSVDVSYDYKAALIDEEKNLIGFSGYEDTQVYYLYCYEQGEGFKQLFSRDLAGYSYVRGLYADSRFYLVTNGTVESFSMDGFEKIDDIVL